MKTIGMIGGLTWLSTAQYYRRLNEMAAEQLGGSASAKLLLMSVNRQAYVQAYLEQGDEQAAGQVVLDAAVMVEKGGADFIMICCNNAHRFVPLLQQHIRIPILHIAQASALAAKAQGITRLGLLGIRKTMEEPFYRDALQHYGIEAILPDADDRQYIHDTIYTELVKNQFLQPTRLGYLQIMERLMQQGAQGIILGCTEIPLLIGQDDTKIPLFDTTELHCRAALSAALSPAAEHSG